MHKPLKQLYLILLLPAAILLPLVYLVCETALLPIGPMTIAPVFHPAFFIAGAVCAIAGPIFIRTWFAHSVRDRTSVTEKEFMKFQKRLLWVALVTPYLALAGLWLSLPKFYIADIVLMALYAVYYYYPSVQRIRFDARIFKVK